MTKPQSFSTEQLLDLLLLGLMFLRVDRPGELTRPGSSVFHSLRHAGAITEAQRRAVVNDYKLHGLMMTNGVVQRGDRRRYRRQYKELAEQTDKWVIILVPGNHQLMFGRLLGADGYSLAITESGFKHAGSVASEYEQLIDSARFTDGWEAYKTQMRGIRGAGADLAGQPYQPVSSIRPRIRLTSEA